MAVLTILPSLLYLSLFSLHFSLLTKVHKPIFKVKMEMVSRASFLILITYNDNTIRREPTTL